MQAVASGALCQKCMLLEYTCLSKVRSLGCFQLKTCATCTAAYSSREAPLLRIRRWQRGRGNLCGPSTGRR